MKQKISRRRFCRALAAGAALLALPGCRAASDSPDGSVSAAPDSASASSAAGTGAAGDWLLTQADYPMVDGSTACIPLMAAMLHETTGMDLTEAQTSITVSTTGYAWERLALYTEPSAAGSLLLVVYEAPDYIQQKIAAEGTRLEVTPIGLDALVFMVNEQNPVQSLTRQQLVDIYTGKITNWQQVGGEDSEIVAFQRSPDSGSQALFLKLAMDGQTPMEAPTELAPTDMGDLVDQLAAYNNAGNALGFSVYYYIDQMYSQPGLRLMAVDGVLPANETIGDGSYPFCNPFYAAIRADAPADSPARRLYDWLCSEEGAACVAGAGYVPAGPVPV